MTTDLDAVPPVRAESAPAAHAGSPRVDDERLDPWRSFLHAHAKLSRRLDEELQAAHHLSLAEYDALLQLARAPGRRLRMSVLAERVLLSRSGITRLVDRLEGAGLVQRSACVTDARGAEAILTQGGLQGLRAAARTHLAGVERYFLGVVDPADLVAIQRGLGRVIGGLGSGPAADPNCATDDA